MNEGEGRGGDGWDIRGDQYVCMLAGGFEGRVCICT